MPKRILAIAALALSLGGCASLTKTWNVIAGTSASPTQIIVAANAFDAGEASATQYLLFCKATVPAPSYCALSTRKSVVSAVRAGRAARDQLEPYIVSGAAGPIALYNTFVAAISTLQSKIPMTRSATSPTASIAAPGSMEASVPGSAAALLMFHAVSQ